MDAAVGNTDDGAVPEGVPAQELEEYVDDDDQGDDVEDAASHISSEEGGEEGGEGAPDDEDDEYEGEPGIPGMLLTIRKHTFSVFAFVDGAEDDYETLFEDRPDLFEESIGVFIEALLEELGITSRCVVLSIPSVDLEFHSGHHVCDEVTLDEIHMFHEEAVEGGNADGPIEIFLEEQEYDVNAQLRALRLQFAKGGRKEDAIVLDEEDYGEDDGEDDGSAGEEEEEEEEVGEEEDEEEDEEVVDDEAPAAIPIGENASHHPREEEGGEESASKRRRVDEAASS